MLMSEKRSTFPHRSGKPPAAGPDPDDGGLGQLSKTISFAGHEDLYRQVLAVMDRTKGSFNKAALAVIEAGLKSGLTGTGGDQPEVVRAADLPAWLRSAVYEAARLTGLAPASTIIDCLSKNIRSYLETARGLEADMARLLTPGTPTPPDKK